MTHATRRYERTARVNEVVREVLADELERLSDPRLGFVTVTGVEVTPTCAKPPSTIRRSRRPAPTPRRRPRRRTRRPRPCGPPPPTSRPRSAGRSG